MKDFSPADDDELPSPPRGRFQPGRSGNPAGRPRNSRNRATLFAEALRSGDDVEIERTLDRARRGDRAAIRGCAELLRDRSARGRPRL